MYLRLAFKLLNLPGFGQEFQWCFEAIFLPLGLMNPKLFPGICRDNLGEVECYIEKIRLKKLLICSLCISSGWRFQNSEGMEY